MRFCCAAGPWNRLPSRPHFLQKNPRGALSDGWYARTCHSQPSSLQTVACWSDRRRCSFGKHDQARDHEVPPRGGRAHWRQAAQCKQQDLGSTLLLDMAKGQSIPGHHSSLHPSRPFYSARRGGQSGMCRAAASSVVHQVVATIPMCANHSCCVLRTLTHSTHTSAVHQLAGNVVVGVAPILGGAEEAWWEAGVGDGGACVPSWVAWVVARIQPSFAPWCSP